VLPVRGRNIPAFFVLSDVWVFAAVGFGLVPLVFKNVRLGAPLLPAGFDLRRRRELVRVVDTLLDA
jgi:hypothetical protein